MEALQQTAQDLFNKPWDLVAKAPERLQSFGESASTLARELSETAGTLANELVSVKTREVLAEAPLQQDITLARKHRQLSVTADRLVDSIKEKRTELEESFLLIEEIQAAIAAREHILANPVVRRPPPDPAAEARRRAAAAALYSSITRDEDEAEDAAYSESLGGGMYYDDAYEEDVYMYDEKGAAEEPTSADRAIEHLRSMVPDDAPAERGASAYGAEEAYGESLAPAGSRQGSAAAVAPAQASRSASFAPELTAGAAPRRANTACDSRPAGSSVSYTHLTLPTILLV